MGGNDDTLKDILQCQQLSDLINILMIPFEYHINSEG
jgi:hypothetical protein